MQILSWNVNGLRAACRKGFHDWLERSGAPIVGVQEVRATREQLEKLDALPPGWHVNLVAAERKGYSGVALFSREPADSVVDRLGEARFDVEGRFQLARFGRLSVANVYFPNGNGKDRDNSRIPYKLAFYDAVFDHLDAERRRGQRVLVMGDFNTAHADIDLARPRQNKETSGFTPEERDHFGGILDRGWVDVFRRQTSEPGHYTWWSQRQGVRAKNIGWRIDYVLASKAAARHVEGAFIQPHVLGSDHCPVGVEVAPAILG